MVTIKIAQILDYKTIAQIGKKTFVESHGPYILDKADLISYTETSFDLEKVKNDLQNSNFIFFLLLVDDTPIGYSKLVSNLNYQNKQDNESCKLERIYILQEYLHLKLGQQLLNAVLEKANTLHFKQIWLCVYIKNARAIRFYSRNMFVEVGKFDFLINSTGYENYILEKSLT